MKLDNEVMDEVFTIAQGVRGGSVTLTAGRDRLSRTYGMNPNSAAMMIRSLCHLIGGERYRRALTIGATEYFLEKILQEYGRHGLQRALKGLSLHIDYRHSYGVTVPGLQTVLSRYAKQGGMTATQDV